MALHVTRRKLLAASLGSVALAGCLGPDDQDDESGIRGGEAGQEDGDEPATEGGMGDDGGGEGGDVGGQGGDYDLREANVAGVEVEEVGDGEFEFDVTLHHDDTGEEGYANRWQVETRDGEELGRRELRQEHGAEPFTRSATIAVPSGEECVVVRGHDQTHEFGGQAMLVSLPGGETEARQQGEEPTSFEDAECP